MGNLCSRAPNLAPLVGEFLVVSPLMALFPMVLPSRNTRVFLLYWEKCITTDLATNTTRNEKSERICSNKFTEFNNPFYFNLFFAGKRKRQVNF